MKRIDNPDIKLSLPDVSDYVNKSTLRTVLFFSGGIILFIAGVIIYGILLNLRDIPLREAMQEKGIKNIDEVYLVIDRSSFTLRIFIDSVAVKSYRASFGKDVKSPKREKGDNATPVGEYNICSIDTVHRYYIFLQLNYPNMKDASDALRKNIISQEQFDEIKLRLSEGDCPPQDTPAGGYIGIQGIGRLNYIFKNLPFVFNWTNGSIAVSNEDIDEIYSLVKKGTKVVIK